MLTEETFPALQRALAEADLDGWLLYDFRGTNPIAVELLGLEGMLTRRVFALVPREGVPRAIGHAMEVGPWRRWPAAWPRETYISWRTLESHLARLVGGRRVAMEYSPGDAVPYLDRIPAGVLEMVRGAGAREVVPSGELVSRFYAAWTPAQLASHVRAADAIARIARDALALAGARARTPTPIAEHELADWIRERFAWAGLSADHGPNVSVGANAANPHYEPSPAHPHPIGEGALVLLDLWAREDGGVYADQTWMAVVGAPTTRMTAVWDAVRAARDAAIALLRERTAAGQALRGAEVDDAARGVIEARGLASHFWHRTGHSIDARELQGSGPHIDNLETREERVLVPGVGFSIEPGVYVPGELGVRSEVNAFIEPGRVLVTPAEYQHGLLVV
jgi:Xaa-Pro aminopeptidase